MSSLSTGLRDQPGTASKTIAGDSESRPPVFIHPLEFRGINQSDAPRLHAQAECEAGGGGEQQLVRDVQAYVRMLPSRLALRGVAPECSRAWREFYAEYNPLIRRVVRACRVRARDLDDCVQEVWTVLLRKLDTFDSQRLPWRFRAWLTTLVQHQVAGFFRRSVRDLGRDAADPEFCADRTDLSPADLYERRRDLRLVQEAIVELRRRLSAVSFSVVERRWFGGENVPEIAARLGLTCEQVWYREYRGLKKLRQLLLNRGVD
jgi:RNA polymerase sigma factor (sigma-70 family)